MRWLCRLLLFPFLFQSLPGQSQDANYWTPGYGPGGFLTPGAVIADNRDSGVLFYNPALLAYSHKSSASITGNIYQLQSVNFKDGAGTGLDLSSTGGSIIPLIGAGTIAMKGRHPFTVGYALIRNPVISYSSTQRRDAHINVLDDSYSPGPEYYVGQIAGNNSITETSAILSAGMEISPHWAAGIWIEGQFRKQDLSQNITSRALYNVTGIDTVFPPVASSQSYYQVSASHAGIRFKAGLAYNEGAHHLGLLVSSPLVHIWGRSTLYADAEINDLKIAGAPLNLLANTRQTGLGVRWKAPLSIGLGYALDYSERGQIYLSAEYFGSVGIYNVITPRNDYFIRPDTGSNNISTSELLRLRDKHHGVLNASIGISFPLTGAVLGYCSIRTDFTYADDSLMREAEHTTNITNWNLWHMQLGANVAKRKFNLRPGLLLSYGSSGKAMQPVNFDDPHESNILLGDTHTVKGRTWSVGVMFSYIHNL